jgi:cobalt-zinc-cadmium efflux system outer membrane protein
MAIDVMRTWSFVEALAAAALALMVATAAVAQTPPPQTPPATSSGVQSPSTANQTTIAAPPVHLSLDRAIELAMQHNHSLLAARATIEESRAEEITANLRPNPLLSWDAQFLPLFNPSTFSSQYVDNSAQFDIGVSYLFERGKKRQHRLEAARDQTAATAAGVLDNERTIAANVAQQFVGALLANANLELARMDLESFQNTVDISQTRYQAGDIGEGDLLKIKLQLLQFQMDLNSAQLAKVQALANLRALLGFESIPESYDVDGELAYQPVRVNLDDLKLMALSNRPDYRAAQLGVTAAQSQFTLAQAVGKRDLTAAVDYTHVGGVSAASFFFNIELPLFTRNQGEIARARFGVNQAQESRSAASQTVLTDVTNAYENLHTNDEVVTLYNSGYLQQAQDSRDISQYAYQRGAASLLDYLDSERSYRATQLAYRQALASYMLALEQLRQAVGTRSLP